MAITFQINTDLELQGKKKLKEWINKVVLSEKKLAGQINFLFTGDKELLEKNIQYLNHNTLTDIITFDYSERNKISGDIIISAERVRENARKFEVSFEEELRRVMIHGILHLCGYKDKSKEEKEMMRKKENRALRLFA